MTENRSGVALGAGVATGRGGREITEKHKESLAMMITYSLDYCFEFIYTSKLYTFKYTQLIVCQIYLSKAIKNVNITHTKVKLFKITLLT